MGGMLLPTESEGLHVVRLIFGCCIAVVGMLTISNNRYLGFLLFIVGCYLVGFGCKAITDWKYRPMRLCTKCQTVAQPLQQKSKRWYCAHCGAKSPVRLETAEAEAYFTEQRTRPWPPSPQ